MDFAKTIIDGALNILAALAAIVLVIVTMLFLARLLPIVLPVLFRAALAIGQIVGQLLAQIIAQVAAVLVMFAKPLFYVLMVAADVLSVFATLPLVHTAYGGDLPAILPAAVICLLPIIISLGSGQGWWSLFAAAGLIYGAGLVIDQAHPLARAAIVSTAIAAILAYQILNTEKAHHEKDTLVDPARPVETRPTMLHGQPNARSVSEDSWA